MKQYLYRSNIDISLLTGIVLYLAAAIILFPHFRYQMNPDGISYMSIAQKYCSGDFSNAINGYWGPLISWLMVPFLAAGLEPLVAANFLLIMTGLVVIIQSWSLMKRIEIDNIPRLIVLCVTAIVVIFFVYRAISPDLLFASFTLALILKILNSSLAEKKHSGIFFGLLGAGLYFTKSFGFPFFIASYIIICIIFYFRKDFTGKRKIIALNFITGAAVFILLSGIWIALISNKYDQLVIGTAGIYNRAISASESQGHPMFYAGLIDPPNSTAVSIWEDVGTLKLEGWGILDSRETIIHEIDVFYRMFRNTMRFLYEFSVFSIPVLIIIIVFLLKKGKAILYDSMFYPVLIMMIMIFGYSLIAIDPRYIWVCDILLLIVGVKLLDLMFEKISLKKIFRIIITGLFGISFLIMPVKEIRATKDSCYYIVSISESISDLNISGKTASYNDWGSSLYLSFYNSWQYYGINGGFGESYIEEELVRKGIDYYFVWRTDADKLKFIEKYREITNGTTGGLKIYELK